MSYVVHCWERPLPESLAQADAIHQRLSEETGPEPPVFALLQTQLRRALLEEPAYAGMDFDGLEPGLPAGGPVLSLGIPTAFLSELQPLLVREALALGLVVYDDQAGICYHPLQRQLTHEGAETVRAGDLQPRPLPPAPRKLTAEPDAQALAPREEIQAWIAARRRQPLFQEALLAKGAQDAVAVDPLWLQARVLRRLGPWFLAQGFVERSASPERTEFARITEGGLQSWSLAPFLCTNAFPGSGPGFSIRCDLQPWLPALLKSVPGNGIPLVAPPHEALAWAEPAHRSDILLRVRDRAQLERVLDAYLPSLEEALLPLFEACRTPHGVLAVARRDEGRLLVPTAALLKLAHWEGAADHGDLMLKLQKLAREHDLHPAQFIWTACALRALPQAFGALAPARP